MTIVALVTAEKEGQLESKIMKAASLSIPQILIGRSVDAPLFRGKWRPFEKLGRRSSKPGMRRSASNL